METLLNLHKTVLDLSNLKFGKSNSPQFNIDFNAYQKDGYKLDLEYTVTSKTRNDRYTMYNCVTDNGKHFTCVYNSFPDGSHSKVGFINEGTKDD